MSDRDKKLLVYLGALIILAAAYFLVGRPYLDKIDQLSTEKSQLETQLREKREAFEKKAVYEQEITEANEKIQAIIDEFPEDNTDEKSIMFVANAERDIPAWFAQIKFADVTENSISEESASDAEAAAEQQAVAAADETESVDTIPESAPEDAEGESSARGDGETGPQDLIVRDTELGLKFTTQYDGFKKWLAYVRDYEDRIVIKEIEVTYDSATDLVGGTMTLSQYALLGPGRELPPVETATDDLGKENVFIVDGSRKSMIELIGEMASDLIDAIVGGLNGTFANEEESYFINVTTATDNTSAKTIGRAKDPSGTTYLTSNSNDKESVNFTLKGADGRYWAEYELGGYSVTDDEFRKDITGKVVLRIISSSKSDANDKSAISLHLHNTSDIPLVVNIENDDPDNPRVEISDQEGDITVNR